VATFQQTGKMQFSGRAIQPERNERSAWKDTVKAYPGYITRVIAKFDLPTNAQVSPGKKLLYVWHCHILEHEDNDNAARFKVIA